jgi:hypothetical protein
LEWLTKDRAGMIENDTDTGLPNPAEVMMMDMADDQTAELHDHSALFSIRFEP